MAIKIIKQGKQTKFKKICPDCGCEFEYEQEDVNVDYTVCLTTYPGKYNTYVICPCCGKHLHHGYTEAIGYSYPDVTYTTTETWYKDCDKCPSKPDPNKVVVGDTPCDWCIKRQFTCK